MAAKPTPSPSPVPTNKPAVPKPMPVPVPINKPAPSSGGGASSGGGIIGTYNPGTGVYTPPAGGGSPYSTANPPAGAIIVGNPFTPPSSGGGRTGGGPGVGNTGGGGGGGSSVAPPSGGGTLPSQVPGFIGAAAPTPTPQSRYISGAMSAQPKTFLGQYNIGTGIYTNPFGLSYSTPTPPKGAIIRGELPKPKGEYLQEYTDGTLTKEYLSQGEKDIAVIDYGKGTIEYPSGISGNKKITEQTSSATSSNTRTLLIGEGGATIQEQSIFYSPPIESSVGTTLPVLEEAYLNTISGNIASIKTPRKEIVIPPDMASKLLPADDNVFYRFGPPTDFKQKLDEFRTVSSITKIPGRVLEGEVKIVSPVAKSIFGLGYLTTKAIAPAAKQVIEKTGYAGITLTLPKTPTPTQSTLVYTGAEYKSPTDITSQYSIYKSQDMSVKDIIPINVQPTEKKVLTPEGISQAPYKIFEASYKIPLATMQGVSKATDWIGEKYKPIIRAKGETAKIPFKIASYLSPAYPSLGSVSQKGEKAIETATAFGERYSPRVVSTAVELGTYYAAGAGVGYLGKTLLFDLGLGYAGAAQLGMGTKEEKKSGAALLGLIGLNKVKAVLPKEVTRYQQIGVYAPETESVAVTTKAPKKVIEFTDMVSGQQKSITERGINILEQPTGKNVLVGTRTSVVIESPFGFTRELYSGKYSPSTARGYKEALKTLEKVMPKKQALNFLRQQKIKSQDVTFKGSAYEFIGGNVNEKNLLIAKDLVVMPTGVVYSPAEITVKPKPITLGEQKSLMFKPYISKQFKTGKIVRERDGTNIILEDIEKQKVFLTKEGKEYMYVSQRGRTTQRGMSLSEVKETGEGLFGVDVGQGIKQMFPSKRFEITSIAEGVAPKKPRMLSRAKMIQIDTGKEPFILSIGSPALSPAPKPSISDTFGAPKPKTPIYQTLEKPSILSIDIPKPKPLTISKAKVSIQEPSYALPVIKPSIYEGTGQYERTEEQASFKGAFGFIDLAKSQTSFGTISAMSLKEKQREKSMFAELGFTGQIERTETIEIPKERTATTTIPSSIQKNIQAQRYNQRQEQKLINQTIGTLTPIEQMPIEPKPKIPKKTITKIPFEDEDSFSKTFGYIPEAKIRGKFKQLSGVVSKERALATGARFADVTLSRTFRITPTRVKVKKEKISATPSLEKFRAFRQIRGQRSPLSNTYIERAKYALERPEQRIIKPLARQAKRVGSGIKNMFGF